MMRLGIAGEVVMGVPGEEEQALTNVKRKRERGKSLRILNFEIR
jgi:hypothetical protein